MPFLPPDPDNGDQAMQGQRSTAGRSLALVATLFQLLAAVLVTLAAIAFVVLVPQLGGLEGAGPTGGGDPGSPFQVTGLGFSLVGAVATILVTLTLVFWMWVLLDVVLVLRPLGRGELLAAEPPALVLGILQTVFGGLLPGLLLLAASRQVRAAIRAIPALEAERSRPARLPASEGWTGARVLGRSAMVGLGLLWGIAGVSMFQNQFYLHLPDLIRTASQGSPSFLSGWFQFWVFATSLGSQPAVYAAGIFQIALAAALLVGFARKIAYFAGLFAAVFLWIVPEAFGGPFVLGAFSLGPGIVYAIGLLALIALNATYGADRFTLDGLIERRFPAWARLAEISVGLIPPIGRWYARHATALSRSVEVAFGVVLAASASLAWSTRLGQGLAAALANRSLSNPGGAAGWYTLWAGLTPAQGTVLAEVIIVTEYVVATALLLGIARKVIDLVGLALTLFVWGVVEGFGGAPGPGYTDPGVGIAEAFAFLAILGIVATRVAERSTIDRWIEGRLSAWRRVARFRTMSPPVPVASAAR